MFWTPAVLLWLFGASWCILVLRVENIFMTGLFVYDKKHGISLHGEPYESISSHVSYWCVGETSKFWKTQTQTQEQFLFYHTQTQRFALWAKESNRPIKYNIYIIYSLNRILSIRSKVFLATVRKWFGKNACKYIARLVRHRW